MPYYLFGTSKGTLVWRTTHVSGLVTVRHMALNRRDPSFEKHTATVHFLEGYLEVQGTGQGYEYVQ